MIVIFAITQIRQEKIERFEAVMKEYEALVNDEPGCVIYCMARSALGPNTYRNVEIFRDQAAIDAHVGSAHFKAAVEATGGFIVGEPVIEVCQSLR